MKVKDLIQALREMPQDAEVYGVSDHGQTPEKVQQPSIVYVESAGHTLWDSYYTNKEEAAEDGAVIQVVIL